MNCNLALPVYVQAARAPLRLALVADTIEHRYSDLAGRASAIAHALQARGLGRASRIGILGSRSLLAVEALLGVIWAGATYVPLGLRWPPARIQAAMALARLDAVIADHAGAMLITPALLDAAPAWMLPDAQAVDRLAGSLRSRLPDLVSLAPRKRPSEPVAVADDELAYIVFTSGTTGVPKAVMVPVGAVRAYLAALGERKALTPNDRASQFTELTFDPAIGEILLPWYAGASLHVVPPVSRISPAKFIREQRLTIWGSTPAAAAWMRDTRSLRPGAFAHLRYTSFGGEPLALGLVEAWQAAAPASVIDNLYGPTEATVDCAGQRVEPGARPVVTPGRGMLAIGIAHPGTELAVLDAERRPVAPGRAGELAIAGAQLSLGYLDNPEATAARFPIIAGKRWYLTGDIAMQDAAGIFHHLGRRDHQIKLQGHRVELEEIEAHARAAAASDQVAAVAWPLVDGVVQAIVCFVAATDLDPAAIREGLRARLPAYMVPASVLVLPRLPLTSSGKVDRQALVARLAMPTPHAP